MVCDDGTLGRADTKEVLLTRDLNAALERLNPDLPASAIENALRVLTVYDVSRSMVQHNRDFYRMLRGGVPVEYRDPHGRHKTARARVIDFDNAPGSNRFLAVREMILAEDTDGRRRALGKILPMQRQDFEGIFRAMDGYPVTIRLLDPPLHEFLPKNEDEIAEGVRRLAALV